MKKLWNKYKNTISNNCNPPAMAKVDSVGYWRNTLFSTTMIFILPLCLIALIPALFLITYENKEYITILHFTTIGLMGFIAFAPKVSVKSRKLVFSFTVFAFAIVLNIFTAPSSGSVLVYFLAACIYSIIIFDNKYAFWWSHLVLLISIGFSISIHIELFDFSHNVDMSSVNEWIAVSANLVFLCYLSSALIPKIFSGIENYIKEQNRLKSQLEVSKTILQAKNRELEQYANVASHDLQEPLRMVTSFMQKLRSKYGDQLDDKGLMYMEFAEDGAARMKQIIVDLLNISRANKPTEEIEEVDLNHLMASFLELRKKAINHSKAQIEFDSLPTIKVIKPLTTQVFHCLFDNALKYAQKETAPIVKLRAKELKQKWQFSISDNGIGIDPQFFDKIFDLFQRLHNRDEYEGTGIGLSVAKRGVEFMGGEIWLESEPGVGSTFYFTIPKEINFNET